MSVERTVRLILIEGVIWFRSLPALIVKVLFCILPSPSEWRSPGDKETCLERGTDRSREVGQLHILPEVSEVFVTTHEAMICGPVAAALSNLHTEILTPR